MTRGVKRPHCFYCGSKRVPDDESLFCTRRCAADWAEVSAWNLQDIGINDEGEFETGLAGAVDMEED